MQVHTIRDACSAMDAGQKHRRIEMVSHIRVCALFMYGCRKSGAYLSLCVKADMTIVHCIVQLKNYRTLFLTLFHLLQRASSVFSSSNCFEAKDYFPSSVFATLVSVFIHLINLFLFFTSSSFLFHSEVCPGKRENWIKASALSDQSGGGVPGHVRASKPSELQQCPALLWLWDWQNGGLIVCWHAAYSLSLRFLCYKCNVNGLCKYIFDFPLPINVIMFYLHAVFDITGTNENASLLN